MDYQTHIDPFKLVALSEEIDGRCVRIIKRDLPKVIEVSKLQAVKISFRDETAALLTEIVKEWNHFSEQLGPPHLLGEDWVIPSAVEMAAKLPTIYCSPPKTELRTWHIERLRWTMSSWIRAWCQLSECLPPHEPQTAIPESWGKAINLESGKAKSDAFPRPSEIFEISRLWQMVRLLTLEYLQEKAALVSVVEGVKLRITIEKPDASNLVESATDAFWEMRPDALVLMGMALREALVTALGFKEFLETQPFSIPTSVLVGIGKRSGLEFPLGFQPIGNLTADIERFQSLHAELGLSYVFPAFHVLHEATMNIKSQSVTHQTKERAILILMEYCQGFEK